VVVVVRGDQPRGWTWRARAAVHSCVWAEDAGRRGKSTTSLFRNEKHIRVRDNHTLRVHPSLPPPTTRFQPHRRARTTHSHRRCRSWSQGGDSVAIVGQSSFRVSHTAVRSGQLGRSDSSKTSAEVG
jgi:hypothetical protein